MPKIVVFDSGFGGELFADRVEDLFPNLEVIRVIDWRHAHEYVKNRLSARAAAEKALGPYIGKVDVIMLANHLLSVDIGYFRHRHKNQKFSGFDLAIPCRCRAKSKPENALVLTTKSVRVTPKYLTFKRRINMKTKTINCDDWVELIDNGELTDSQITERLNRAITKKFHPQVIILACTQFADIKQNLRAMFGPVVAIEDGHYDALKNLCAALDTKGYHIKSR